MDIIRHTMDEIATTMLNTHVASEAPRVDPSGTKVFRGVLAWCAVTGAWRGMGEIYYSPGAAAEITRCMLLEDSRSEEIDETVLDMSSEIANIVVGNVKNHLEDRLGTLTMSVPTVAAGLVFHAKSAMRGPYTVVPFTINAHRFEVKLCLEPADTR